MLKIATFWELGYFDGTTTNVIAYVHSNNMLDRNFQ